MNSVLKEDLQEICSNELIDWNEFKNGSILITGSTGLIGSLITKSFCMKNDTDDLNAKLYLVVRSIEKAMKMYGIRDDITYIETPIEEFNGINKKVDYIIHAASPTKSKFFINNPVETIDSAAIGTKRILDYARTAQVKSMIYLSSMEMYGILNNENVTEDMLGYINPLDVRSSYSEGKRICELYCYSYCKEYGVPVKIGRIAQTFGPGISKEENRVYKFFADSILDKKDIVLKSTGETKINYSYTTDTVSGLLYVLLKGKDAEAYNIVGEKTNMTILDSAKWLAEQYGDGKVNVRIEIPKENAGFAPNNSMILSNKKLKELGWESKHSIMDGYDRLLKYMAEEREKDSNVHEI